MMAKKAAVESCLNFSNKLELNAATRSKRRAWSWTALNVNRREDVLSIFNGLKKYWPLTERQAFYRLLSSRAVSQAHWHRFSDPARPRVDVYDALGKLLKWTRIDEFLPWEAIIDETRILTQKVGHASAQDFIYSELDHMLRGYSRCLASDQAKHIEVWIEKQALLRLVEPVADKYCRRVLCCKGYNSISFQSDFYHRMEDVKAAGLQPVVLYFGDWDPSGVDMLYTAMQTLGDELGLTGVDYYRCGINPEHFAGLEADPVPLKETDSRAKKFIRQHGRTCYELDALHPEELKNLVENHIRRFTDIDKVMCNYQTQGEERNFINNLKSKITDFVEDLLEGQLGE
ncbi:MAG: hypothetical protein KKD99_12305 [Proteobacteria bacterium]|nr:hypothetical protein [Pseudomonadota bacterium]MBU4355317.1 hypothetical protein [Pseudomonadota bacterium]MBU4449359.1 hypothetical protein [Pseudomonadota bacterium]MCG2772562.1 hypothetical protein [Desulfobacterales bacterium]